jgi:hypothetical protein
MTDGWIDLTTPALAYEVEFNPLTCQYRHRIRRIIPSDDPTILIVRAIDACWAAGKPPPYPSYPT